MSALYEHRTCSSEAVQDAHEPLDAGHALLFTALPHDVAQTRDHGHHLAQRTHVQQSLELILHVPEGEDTLLRDFLVQSYDNTCQRNQQPPVM